MRVGDVVEFKQLMVRHSAVFGADATHSLIARLQQNVLRTAIRKISITYSRITMQDIANKIQMNDKAEAQRIVEKVLLINK